ncbi:hypothetical protein [Stenotrophomonas maltophilia]|uniref:hypothetical protein n=1 Tax=Stenotrophomonas maltophilia TaxID=40324 RepID=UPI0013DB58EC|nr:hypothetical protein [Stenotrophomonas maltophilia]
MKTNDKTLADVQPGGRVRLGDQLPPLPCTDYNAYSDGSEPLFNAQQMRDYARAALSAQPSPGGQGDALHAAVSAIYFDDGSDYQGALWNVVRALDPVVAGLLERDPYAAYEATKPGNPALAARQPVGEPVAWQVNMTRSGRGWEACTQECYEETLRTGRYMGLPAGTQDVEVRKLYAAQTAQAVDLGQLRELAGEMDRFRTKWKTVSIAEFNHYADRLLDLIDSQAVGK